MSDAATTTDSTQDGTNNSGETSTATTEESKTFTQDEINSLLAKQKRDLRAEANEWKTKASKFDELAEANKSEIDKAMDRVTKAEAEVASVPSKVADALRAHLVALHEIDADDAELFLTANDPELLLKQVSRLTGRESERKSKNNHVPNEGKNPSSAAGAEVQVTRALFGGS